MTRKCQVFVDNASQEATFHQFGKEIVHGSDNEPRERSIAIIETKDGKVHHVEPKKVKFLDQPS